MKCKSVKFKTPFICLLIFVSVFILSCEKDTGRVMFISIKNNTQNAIECNFTPTEFANGYKISEILDTSRIEMDIYSTDNLELSPVELLSRAYESFSIKLNDSLNTVLVFEKYADPENYSINPYKNENAWQFEQFTKDFPTNFKRNTTLIDNYIFVIDSANVVIQTNQN